MQWRIQDFLLGGADPLGGHRPLTHMLFGENVCENENIDPVGGGGHMPAAPPGSANAM